MKKLHPQITRRAFAFGISAAGGGLILGISPTAGQAETAPSQVHDAKSPEVTVWVVIERDDTVIIRVARSEMGQGGFTSLPMLVAEELECDWSRVRAEYAAPSENLARGRPWGDMVTAGSLSIRASQAYLRKAGAQARLMLVAEAAARWGVSDSECVARSSVVTHRSTGSSFRYGEIAQAAALRPIPQQVPLKRPEDWRLIGRSVNRLDTVDKVMGRPIYASDVRLPNMLYAAVAACPSHGGRLKSFDSTKILEMQGVRHVVPVGDNAVAVVAASWWQAKKALEMLPINWDTSSSAGLSTEAIRRTFLDGLEADDVAVGRKAGDVDAALASASSIVHADYQVPYLAHTTMEPQTCTAHVTANGVEVWAPTQNGEGTLRTVARTLGLDPSQVVVHKHHLGGGFGRRGLAQDWARQAVLIAKQIEQPVKMIWTREEDVRHDYYRPAFIGRHTAGFDADGKFIGWKTRLCGSSISFGLAQDRLKNGQDLEMMSGFLEADMFYDVPNVEVGYVMRNTAVPVGFWRGVNHSQNGYIREAFIDELAHVRAKDPYQFRRELLANSPRSLAVLDEVARRADWGKARDGIHQGIAIVECYDSVCAHVVEISVDPAGAVKVHRVVCAIDSGYVVNPGIVVAQMEGAIVYGLIAALTGEITLNGGRVDQSNFHDYPALRMNEMPEVETYLVPSGDKYIQRWGGIGEPGVPPLAPALVNAVFAATGKRIRSLPLKNHDLIPV
jgi:isoquinoline 1-oxidoreductase subunit beta